MALATSIPLGGPWAYVGLFALSTAESSAFLGLAVPGETFVLAAGTAAAQGRLSLWWLLLAVVLGGILGDSIGYALGRRFGGCREGGWLGKIWSCERMERVQRFFDRHGRKTIFLARFVGFLRPLAPFAAGAARMSYRPFLLYNVAGAITWGTGTALAGYYLGPAVERLIRSGGVWAVLGIGLVVTATFVLRQWRRRRRRVEPRGQHDESQSPADGSGPPLAA